MLEPGRLLLYGGTSVDGKPVNDGYVLEVASMRWHCMYFGDPEELPSTGPMAVLQESKLYNLTSGAGKSSMRYPFVLFVHFAASMISCSKQTRADFDTGWNS